jgi:outer membrane protein
MKKLNIIIQIVLAVAVIGLYILHFACKKSSCGVASATATNASANVSGKIAYVNVDSISRYYNMHIDLGEELKGKKASLEADMNNKSKNYQSGVQDYQNKAQKGLITRANAADMEQQLAAEQQKLMQLRDKYMADLAEEEQVMNRQVLNSIMDYLTEYNKTKGYLYVLGNSFGGNILYADKSFDITAEVIKGLNAKYKETAKTRK